MSSGAGGELGARVDQDEAAGRAVLLISVKHNRRDVTTLTVAMSLSAIAPVPSAVTRCGVFHDA